MTSPAAEVRIPTLDADDVIHREFIPTDYVTGEELQQALQGVGGGTGGGGTASMRWDDLQGRPPIITYIEMPGGADRARVNTTTTGQLGPNDSVEWRSPIAPKIGGNYAKVRTDIWRVRPDI